MSELNKAEAAVKTGETGVGAVVSDAKADAVRVETDLGEGIEKTETTVKTAVTVAGVDIKSKVAEVKTDAGIAEASAKDDKIILIHYMNVAGVTMQKAMDRIATYVKSLDKDAEGILHYVVPIAEGPTRVECMNPKLVAVNEYKKAQAVLDDGKKHMNAWVERIKMLDSTRLIATEKEIGTFVQKLDDKGKSVRAVTVEQLASMKESEYQLLEALAQKASGFEKKEISAAKSFWSRITHPFKK